MVRENTSTRHNIFIRNYELGSFLETFLISGIVAVLVIRFFLAATHYPQLGGKGLHIAHMLWGGLLMLIAIVLLLSFLGKRVLFIASLLGGIGFGTFIDELGKFITSDNNYFFQPAIALIYVVFVLLFLSMRALEGHEYFSIQEQLANALDIMKESIIHPIPIKEKEKALSFLHNSSRHDPRLNILAEIAEYINVATPAPPSISERIANSIVGFYKRLVQSQQFSAILVFFFIAYALLFIVVLIIFLITPTARIGRLPSFSQGCLLFSSIISSFMILRGVLLLHRSRLKAYKWFKYSLIVSILIGQVFLFSIQQLSALGELAANLILLSIINAMLYMEQNHVQQIETIQIST